ncbi:Ras-related protein [Wickerhamomyces ciferrii]|uniref:Ras-related protein n=1 Tax=Wickerhamomyces ciferrii (strain ATCC 14091 / BCRC 22168 / CBS 111 / JCM 3599 / NBRC 0793 / NRRL Y-1031 F-60-10) TaxID=1206466 RepID=K0KJI8_WICCF|nr:Ras-related protein [Wickerhamomyces ciferrii]CCH43141.1 Ras-related protein [Wickerhamomyces ciferrii]
MNTIDSKRSNASIVPISQDQYDYLTKIIIIGSSGTGKSCILHRFIKNDFNINSSQTIGVEFSSKLIELVDDELVVKLQLWDTAGQERFRSLTRSYYRGSAGVILCYDLSNKQSLLELDEYLMDVQALTNNPSIIIVGNKLDLPSEEQQVDEFDVLELINKYEFQFNKKINHFKISAKTGDGINEIFQNLTHSIITKLKIGEIDPNNQNFGIQFGNKTYDNFTINSTQFNTINKSSIPSRIIRRKATTLSLIDRSLDDKNKCWC